MGTRWLMSTLNLLAYNHHKAAGASRQKAHCDLVCRGPIWFHKTELVTISVPDYPKQTLNLFRHLLAEQNLYLKRRVPAGEQRCLNYVLVC